MISILMTLLLLCLLAACNGNTDDNAQPEGTDKGKQQSGNALTVPSEPGSSELLLDDRLELRLAAPADSQGPANYSRSGSMVLGGPESSSVDYEIGLLKEGDELERLIVDLGNGRQDEQGCRLQVALSGTGDWKEFNLPPADKPRELILKGELPVASGGDAYILRFTCDGGQGIVINEVQAELALASGDATEISLDLPAVDASNVNIRVTMQAYDADRRIASGYFGTANMWVERGEMSMQVPIAFQHGYADTTFNLATEGEYDVRFECEFAEPLQQTMQISDCLLPVYEIVIQQPKQTPFSTLDFPALETYGSLNTPDGAVTRVAVQGLALEHDSAQNRSLQLEFSEGWLDQEYGYTRQAATLSHSAFDETQMRDLLAGWIMQEAGVPAPKRRAIHLRVNGVFQGVYVDREVADAAWLGNRGFGDDAELYVMKSFGGLNPRESAEQLDDLFARVNQPDGGMEELHHLINDCARVFTEVGENERYAQMEPLVDRGELLDYFLALSMCSANDNYRSSYAVLDPGDDSGWSLMATDMSLTFGITGLNNPIVSGEEFAAINDMDMIGSIEDNIVLRSLLSSPHSQQVLADRLFELLDGRLNEENTIGRLEELESSMRAELLKQDPAGLSADELDSLLESIRENIRIHWQYMRDEVHGAGGGHEGHDHSGHEH